MMIAIEGMDGVGKTEISKHIAKQYGFIFIEKPLHYFYNDGAEHKYADLMKVAERMYDINDNMIKSFAEYVLGEKVNPYTLDYELELYKTVLKACGENN